MLVLVLRTSGFRSCLLPSRDLWGIARKLEYYPDMWFALVEGSRFRDCLSGR